MPETAKTPAADVKHVALVDDHPMIRRGLGDLINGQSDMAVCCEAARTDEAWKHIEAGRPDIVVLDLMLKHGSALDLLKKIKGEFPSIGVLVLSLHEERLYGERVIRAGADGYVTKEQPSENILEAIRTVLRGETYLSDRLREQIEVAETAGQSGGNTADIAATFTNRELDVFQLIGQGLSTKQIAHRLGISVKTVETYRARLKEKLGVHSGPELSRRAVLWVSEQS